MFGVFTPEQVKTQAQQRALRDNQHARNIAETIEDLLKEKDRVEREYEAMLASHQSEMDARYQQDLDRRKSLEAEIAQLEERRKDALRPLLLSEEDIHSAQEVLRARELAVQASEEENESEQQALRKRLNEVADREMAAVEHEKLLKRKEQGVDIQRQQVSRSSEHVNKLMEQFEKDRAEWETKLAYEQSELDARKNLYDQNDQRLIEREQEIQASLRLLADQRVLLDKGFEELRRLKEKHGK